MTLHVELHRACAQSPLDVALLTARPITLLSITIRSKNDEKNKVAPLLVEHVGDDYLMIATDYPRSDAIDKFPDKTVRLISSNDRISRASRSKILSDNPTKAFGLGA
jgi:predicted TIM-barrel fold metal-dependent hydrolase